MAIVSFDITKGTRGDASILKKLLKGIPTGMGDFYANSAYLSRDICNMVDTLHKTLFPNYEFLPNSSSNK